VHEYDAEVWYDAEEGNVQAGEMEEMKMGEGEVAK
jgi:hypothetical protein